VHQDFKDQLVLLVLLEIKGHREIRVTPEHQGPQVRLVL